MTSKFGDTTENIIPLPSEGRGHEFESRRVRHKSMLFHKLGILSGSQKKRLRSHPGTILAWGQGFHMAAIRKREQSWHVHFRRQNHPTVTGSFKRKTDAELWVRQRFSRRSKPGRKMAPSLLSQFFLLFSLTVHKGVVHVPPRL